MKVSAKFTPNKINLTKSLRQFDFSEKSSGAMYASGITAGVLGMYKVLINKQKDPETSIIQEKLDKIEKDNNIKIIYACEVGSKAWGSDSKDSDYDVRYIYVSPKSHYLNQPIQDNLKNELNEKYDIYGYDLSKVLSLLKEQKYNSFEWLNSPVIYRKTNFSKSLKELVNTNTDLNALAQSYTNLAKFNYTKLIKNKDKIDIKTYLLVVKSILSAEYIHEHQELPPLQYQDLFYYLSGKKQELSNLLQDLLLTKKNNSKNTEPIVHIQELDDFIEKHIAFLDANKKNVCIKTDESTIDNYFEKTISDRVFTDINKITLTPLEKYRFKKYKKDIVYRKRILSSIGIDPQKYLLLKSIIGPEEFSDILKNNTTNEESYSTRKNIDAKTGKIYFENVANAKYRNNFHIHTTYSDGEMSVKELLDSAAKYADKVAKQFKTNENEIFEPFSISITDHNTVEGCKEAVQVIMNNPDRYKNLRIVLGTELSASEKYPEDSKYSKSVPIHILVQCINPHNSNFINAITRTGNKEKIFYASRGSLDEVINIASLEPGSIVGYAHPFAHISIKKLESDHIYEDLIKKFAHLTSDKIAYVETFYQAYDEHIQNDTQLKKSLENLVRGLNLYSAGGLDNHGTTLYK